MIQVIDYKAGNLTSVVKALHFLGAETHVTQSPQTSATPPKSSSPA